GELRAGDMVQATINDSRDIAHYLARLFGARTEDGRNQSLSVPVEALERGHGRPRGGLGRAGEGEVSVRVRFAAGVCGDVAVPADIRLKVVRKSARTSWWKKIFG
ncbi:MAG TPA: hypothetical protein VNI01_12840, partial [Elusimicrobiota bacterium]|nr:hypothetical protein [Elusimicrobiota bacterium]